MGTYFQISKPLAMVGLLVLVFYAGTLASVFTPKTKAAPGFVQPVEARLVERHTVEYIEQPVIIVKNTQRVEKISPVFRNYNDLNELNNWLEKVNLNTTSVYFQSAESEVDCDDYAINLQSLALSNGYILSFEIIDREEYNKLFEIKLPPGQNLHAINLAIINNKAYYIEPQTSEVVFAVYLD